MSTLLQRFNDPNSSSQPVISRANGFPKSSSDANHDSQRPCLCYRRHCPDRMLIHIDVGKDIYLLVMVAVLTPVVRCQIAAERQVVAKGTLPEWPCGWERIK